MMGFRMSNRYNYIMNREEFLTRLDSLNLDKQRYCILSGGVMLLYGLRETTADIDIKVRPDYFEELKTKFTLSKSPKYPNLYELGDDVEVAVRDYDDKDVRVVLDHPVESLELTLQWMLEHNRPKDQEKIKMIENYLKEKNEEH